MPIMETQLPASQRIDKWLWYARFFKTRTLASRFVSAGHVRLSRDQKNIRVDKPKTDIRAGDTLTFVYANRIRIILVVGCGTRRGPASEAQKLYQDQSPPPEVKIVDKTIPLRDAGAGRPTKKDRRAIDALRSGD